MYYAGRSNPLIRIFRDRWSCIYSKFFITDPCKYYATDKQKDIINRILMNNEQKADEEKRQKYNPDDIFANKKENKDIEENKEKSLEENNSLIEYKDSFFEKFKRFIRKLLHID